MINRLVCSFLAFFLAGGALALDLTDEQRAAIEERIKPVGESCLEGDSACVAAAASSEIASGPRSGEEVYQAACMACHDAGVAGAPRFGDAASWAERIAKGMDVLYDSGMSGLPGTGMMAKGGCMNCTDDEITAAVDYMVAGSQ